MARDIILEAREVSKVFPGVRALDEVFEDLAVDRVQ